MRGIAVRLCQTAITTSCLARGLFAQRAYSWQEIQERFLMANPTLQAAQLNVQESRDQETTAYLRPNPDFTVATDGTQLAPSHGVYQPFPGTQVSTAVTYLHEREHKRELRRGSAEQETSIAESQQLDAERSLLFSLRAAFVQTLQAKAMLASARENLNYYDQELGINRERFRAGDISQLDLNRLQLQRVQYESDLAAAQVNLRTAKIGLLMLLNDRTPVDQFDVSGRFEYSEGLAALEEYRNMALEGRPDLKAAMQAIEKAQIDHRLAIANGSTDPTFSSWWTHNPSFNNPFDNNTIGVSVSIPLRIFDKNQGEKARTQTEIGRVERLRDATQAQVFNDVDSAYYTVSNALSLLKPYTETYLPTATTVRDTMSYSYQRGQAALVDFLDSQRDYRATQVAYINLVGSYLIAAAQLNLAVGREVLP
ncbi:MAG TPA: TolC family protein [Bryobacteraceae bacterium]